MTTKQPPAVELELDHRYDENGVFYPEEDGIPMPDAETQGRTFRAVLTPLSHYFRGQPGVHVADNTFVYYEPGNPQRFVSPDCYVVFGVDVAHIFYRNAYRVWEMGKPPDFALEIGSQSAGGYDVREKPELYASIGIGEYWLYDATLDSVFYGAPLRGGYLANGRYEPFDIRAEPDGLVWGYSPTLGLDLCWGPDRLRFRDPATGEFLPDYDESQAAWRESQAALQEAETARAAAEAEAAELRAQIRLLQAQQNPES